MEPKTWVRNISRNAGRGYNEVFTANIYFWGTEINLKNYTWQYRYIIKNKQIAMQVFQQPYDKDDIWKHDFKCGNMTNSSVNFSNNGN